MVDSYGILQQIRLKAGELYLENRVFALVKV